MSWLANKIGGWATKVQQKELTDFVQRMRALDGSELGMILAMATHQRHLLERAKGWNLLSPSLLADQPENFALVLNQTIQQLQREGKPHVAVGVMAWLHSIRAVQSPDLRQLGRDMWAQLARGMPFCEESAASFSLVAGGPELDTRGYEQFPDGLSPQPR